MWGFKFIWEQLKQMLPDAASDKAEVRSKHPLQALLVENAGAEFKRGQFREKVIAHQDFSFSNFSDLYCKEVTFKNCSFQHATFTRCYFRKARFEVCDFTGVSFIECNLRGAKL